MYKLTVAPASQRRSYTWPTFAEADMASDRKSDYRRVCKALEQTLASFLAQLPDLQGAEEGIGFGDLENHLRANHSKESKKRR